VQVIACPKRPIMCQVGRKTQHSLHYLLDIYVSFGYSK